LTIKSLDGFEAEVRRILPKEASVFECPDLRIKELIFELSSGFDLLPLLKLNKK